MGRANASTWDSPPCILAMLRFVCVWWRLYSCIDVALKTMNMWGAGLNRTMSPRDPGQSADD